MKRDFRVELKRIVDFMKVQDIESENLYYVLAALRGPDYGTSDFDPDAYLDKSATTAIIRHAIGIEAYGLTVHGDSDDHVARRCNELAKWSHFKEHAQRAFEILGLEWHANNNPLQEPAVFRAARTVGA